MEYPRSRAGRTRHHRERDHRRTTDAAQADGTGKANVKPNKINIASPAGKPMVVASINDLLGLAICEGVEDALSTISNRIWCVGKRRRCFPAETP